MLHLQQIKTSICLQVRRVYKAATCMMDNNEGKAAKALEPITSIKEEQRNKTQKYVQIKDGPQSTVYLNKKP